jgi:hypothetical protein
MSISQRLRDLLDQRGVKHTVVTHSPAYTVLWFAGEPAGAEG